MAGTAGGGPGRIETSEGRICEATHIIQPVEGWEDTPAGLAVVVASPDIEARPTDHREVGPDA